MYIGGDGAHNKRISWYACGGVVSRRRAGIAKGTNYSKVWLASAIRKQINGGGDRSSCAFIDCWHRKPACRLHRHRTVILRFPSRSIRFAAVFRRVIPGRVDDPFAEQRAVLLRSYYYYYYRTLDHRSCGITIAFWSQWQHCACASDA